VPVRDPFRLPHEVFRAPRKRRKDELKPADEDARSEGEQAIRAGGEGAQRSLDRAGRHIKMTDPVSPEVKPQKLDAVFNEDRELGVVGTHITGGGESITGQATLARGGLLGEVKVADGTTRDAAEVYFEPGYLAGKVDHTWLDRGGRARKAGVAVKLTPESFGIAGKVAQADLQGRVVELGLGVSVDAEREVVDLGADGTGKRRIELARSFGHGVNAGPGAIGEVIGFAGRVGKSKDKSIIYRTTVDDAEARSLVCERGGVVGFFRDKARAAGLKEDPVTVPDLRQPESLKVGDELIVSVSGGFSGALLVGGLPFRVGAMGLMQGEFEVAVKRHDDRRVEVVVTPSSVRGMQARGYAPFVFDADASRVGAKALRQGFVFDLEDPQAHAAYLKLLDGDLPGGLPDNVRKSNPSTSALHAAMKGETLPAGVQRTYVEAIKAKRKRMGVGVGFALWHRGGQFFGFGAEKVRTEEDATRIDPGSIRSAFTRGVEKRRQILLSGTETCGVWARLQRATTFDDTGAPSHVFAGLELELSLTDSRVRGFELNDEMIDKLNDELSLELPHFEEKGKSESREISAIRKLRTDDLELLSHGDAPELAPLREKMAAASSPLKQAEAVQRFVADKGMGAFGAVHRALGGGKVGLALTTSSSAYQSPPDTAEALGLKYPEAIFPGDDTKEVLERFEAASKALAGVKRGLVLLEDDPVLELPQKIMLRAQLKRAAVDLERVIDVSHLQPDQRQVMVDKLERGWTTRGERALIEHLQAAGDG
jgi:hypothetical protein